MTLLVVIWVIVGFVTFAGGVYLIWEDGYQKGRADAFFHAAQQLKGGANESTG